MEPLDILKITKCDDTAAFSGQTEESGLGGISNCFLMSFRLAAHKQSSLSECRSLHSFRSCTASGRLFYSLVSAEFSSISGAVLDLEQTA